MTQCIAACFFSGIEYYASAAWASSLSRPRLVPRVTLPVAVPVPVS
jgi:hypothetical protein